MKSGLIGLLAVFVMLFWVPTTLAAPDIPCTCDRACASKPAPSVGKSFDDEPHRHWYAGRFWRGKCHSSIWLTCWSGDDWYDVMATVLAKAETADRPALCDRLFKLGQDLGHEWARDNAVRSIHTDDMKAWRAVLLDYAEPLSATAKIEALVRARLQ